jgi:hypothetical protein
MTDQERAKNIFKEEQLDAIRSVLERNSEIRRPKAELAKKDEEIARLKANPKEKLKWYYNFQIVRHWIGGVWWQVLAYRYPNSQSLYFDVYWTRVRPKEVGKNNLDINGRIYFIVTKYEDYRFGYLKT